MTWIDFIGDLFLGALHSMPWGEGSGTWRRALQFMALLACVTGILLLFFSQLSIGLITIGAALVLFLLSLFCPNRPVLYRD